MKYIIQQESHEVNLGDGVQGPFHGGGPETLQAGNVIRTRSKALKDPDAWVL